MPQQERARITRERVIEGASRVFARVGFAGASLSDITAEAGMSKGALYFHFTSKEHIARAIVDHEQAVAKESAARVIAAAGSPLEAVMGLCGDFARLVTSDPLIRAGVRLTSEAADFHPPLASPFDDWFMVLEHLFGDAVSVGQVRTDLDVAVFVRFAIPAFTGVQLVSGALTGYADFVPRVREMWLILLPAIASPGRLADALTALDRVLPAEGLTIGR